ncbi:helix-turn-helix domain-containing protein [Planococcus kocurii]|uniref:helix-turn-helix domain-containing protein n=1 Tax=Planococcus kocurii TaxID=1374 RepID=UPI003D03624F
MVSLAVLRKVRGLSVKQVAEHMGVAGRTIYSWERGEREISIQNLYKLLSYYQVDMLISEIPSLIPKKPD